ncbi:hypothetical protein IWW36_001418 [Coemansia brasiliensis]|uniref:GH18 domain-containing protein n=1 Tax=Coemansia brasiliensis TaxID=2650707 RepID=A0A9W8IBR4_9FUNG|nr:hypothetical protein IWW36_001418 [Coemansia brasiliensis]
MNNVDFAKYTHINIAFSIPNEDGSLSFEDDWAMQQITGQIKSGGAKVLMSVGGWTGSNLFSKIFKQAPSRSKLLDSMVSYVKQYNLDGIDIDFEYPGRLGNTCNIYDEANDTPNLLAFLKDLRKKFSSEFGDNKDKSKLITLAVRVQPFDVNGSPASDVSEFAKYVDFANIMAYDINGAWNEKTGPNAPFEYDKQKETTPLSFVSAIDAWTKAGWPANQLVAGLGFYGRSTQTKQDMRVEDGNQYQPQLHDVPLGDSEDAPWYDKCAGITSASGTWQWKHLRDQGVLVQPDTAASPWIRQWDNVSQTPWLFNPDKKLFLSYDDPKSIRIKSDYAASKGLAGVMLWSINMDYNNELIDAARSFGSGSSSESSAIKSNSAESSSTESIGSSASPTASSPSVNSSSTSTTQSLSESASSSPLSSEPTTTSQAPTSSSTAPAQTSSPGNNELAPGQSCTSDGKYSCVDSNGHTAAYVVCTGGKQVAASCAPGTVCLPFQNTIICGWPSLKSLVSGVDSLFSHGN